MENSNKKKQKEIIEPRTLKGFRDFLPEVMIPRKQMIETIEKVYQSFGYAPIDTPALEYADILLGKGSAETDKQLFRFTDNGGRDVALRFDLTVPLARFVAQHFNELSFPFKRYHIAPVWRGENSQKGRYREFYQCDFDIIGTKSNLADLEVAQVIFSALTALGINDFTIRINNRMILNGLMKQLELEDKTVQILRVIDKIEKIGVDNVKKELGEIVGQNVVAIDKIVNFINLKGNNAEIIDRLAKDFCGNQFAEAGILNLKDIIEKSKIVGIPEKNLKIDLSIARGLDYYTGTVYETTLDNLPEIGSICSGGRFDNLSSLYIDKELPGVGASIGIDRLIAALQSLNILVGKKSTVKTLVSVKEDMSGVSFAVADFIRKNGISVEVYLGKKGVGDQIKYAANKNIDFVIFPIMDKIVNLKNIITGENFENLTLTQATEIISKAN